VRSKITYTPRSEATSASELSTLANIYRFIIDSASERGRLPDKSGPDDAMKGSNNDRAATIIPERP
jgi:hypothetical protein